MEVTDREYRFVPHEDRLYSRLVMSTSIRNAILERNQALQAEQVQNDLSFGRQALSIPELDLMHILKKYPEMASHDPQIKKQGVLKFLASPESKPYRVR